MEEPPLKKQRVEGLNDKKDDWDPVVPAVDDEFGAKYTQEETVGITEFINQNFEGFDCILKYKRYSDFVVNEVGMDGEVVVLKDTEYENPDAVNRKDKERSTKPAKPVSEEQPSLDLSLLGPLFSEEKIVQLQELYTSKGTSPSEVLTGDLTKDQRTEIHRVIRTVFNGKLDSQATSTGSIRITCPKHVARRGNAGKWPEGEYCHFTLKKNNRDTMSTASMLAKWLKCHNKVIGYAGTKDRRAITTQRMSALRIKAERLTSLNKLGNPIGIWLGDFTYAKAPVKLGDLKGNRFTITLREVPDSTGMDKIEGAMGSLRENGFINYYGMQRFGTSLVSTHSVGALLLKGDWKGACEAILDVKAGGMNDSLAARELYAKGDVEEAFEKMPRSCLAERAVLGVLKEDPRHYAGGLQAIPRNLRLMYVHAYQSYVWNVVASARVRLSPKAVLDGDLVLVNPINGPSDELDLDDPDAGAEYSLPESENKDNIAIKVLTKEDVESGQYSIHDIVLPTPGYDVIYPSHQELRRTYIDTMSPDGLDPFDMRRVVREVSMVGHYRRVVHQPEDVSWNIIRYNGRETLLDTEELPTEGEFMALKVQLRLGTSQYATMALREICKRDSIHIQYWGKERDDQEKARKGNTVV